MKDVLVSIICTAYNQEKYIKQTLIGLVSQKTNFNYEILVHDDASTDRTPQIIKSFSEEYPELIKPVFQSENQYSQGVKITKDILIPRAKGKYIALCEGDDYWTNPNKIQMQAEVMEQYSNCSICVHKVQGVSEDGSKSLKVFPQNDVECGIVSSEEIVHRMLSKGEWMFHTTSYFFRKQDAMDLSQKKYLFWEKPGYGDFSYIQMAILKGDLYYINKTMSCYRMGAIGSAVKRDAGVERRKEVSQRFIEAIQDFDNVTNMKYHNDSKTAIKRYEFQLADAEKNYKYLLSNEMKDIWKDIPFYAKLRIKISRYFPAFDKFFYLLRSFIREKK